jgi:hypothetical protein
MQAVPPNQGQPRARACIWASCSSKSCPNTPTCPDCPAAQGTCSELNTHEDLLGPPGCPARAAPWHPPTNPPTHLLRRTCRPKPAEVRIERLAQPGGRLPFPHQPQQRPPLLLQERSIDGHVPAGLLTRDSGGRRVQQPAQQGQAAQAGPLVGWRGAAPNHCEQLGGLQAGQGLEGCLGGQPLGCCRPIQGGLEGEGAVEGGGPGQEQQQQQQQ